MNSQNQYDAGTAMVGLSCFVSPDLARDLANDIMSMVSKIEHSVWSDCKDHYTIVVAFPREEMRHCSLWGNESDSRK